MKIFKSHPLIKLLNSYVIDSAQPSNISFLWNFASLIAFYLVIQIITRVTFKVLNLLYNKVQKYVLNIFNSLVWGLSSADKPYAFMSLPVENRLDLSNLFKFLTSKVSVTWFTFLL